MALSAAVMTQARKVMADGVLKFSADKDALLEICRLLSEECDAFSPTRYMPWIDVHRYIVGGLKECDRACAWTTARVRPAETDEQRQAREDQLYAMLATIYLMGTQGVRVGL